MSSVPFLDIPITLFLTAAFASLVIGISKGGFGAGFGMLAVPVLAMQTEPAMAVAILAPLLSAMDVFGLRAYWGQWSWRLAALLLPGGVMGIVIAAWLLDGLSPDMVRLCLGLLALGFSLQQIIGAKSLARLFGGTAWPWALWWSGLSGITSTLAHAGGPPLTIYLIARKLGKIEFVATTVIFFAVINAIKLMPYAWTGLFTHQSLLITLMLLPIAPLGIYVGIWLRDKVNEAQFRWIIILSLMATGIKLIGDGLHWF